MRERAARMVFELQEEQALRHWVRRAKADDRLRGGLTSSKRQHMKELEREVREPRRANEILKTASEILKASSATPIAAASTSRSAAPSG